MLRTSTQRRPSAHHATDLQARHSKTCKESPDQLALTVSVQLPPRRAHARVASPHSRRREGPCKARLAATAMQQLTSRQARLIASVTQRTAYTPVETNSRPPYRRGSVVTQADRRAVLCGSSPGSMLETTFLH